MGNHSVELWTRTEGQNRSLLVGVILFPLILLIGKLLNFDFKIISMASTALLMAFWWMTSALPLAATSLLPLILFPLFGILKGKETAMVYMNYIIFLFLGGFLIALAMEKWKLHRRMALTIISFFGGKPSRMIWGFMAATAFLSMWISNTATAIMMVSIAMAIIKGMEKDNIDQNDLNQFSVALLLSIAYSASIGGLATLVGTPPNLAFVRIYAQTFPSTNEISFGNWMLFALPLAITLFIILAFILTKILFKVDHLQGADDEVIKSERENLPPMSYEEKWIAAIFSLTAILWIFRKPLAIGQLTIPGWSSLLPYPELIDDATVAITMAMILFMIPAKNKNYKENILDVRIFKDVPWGTLLLFGGGFALAKGFKVSGLSEAIGALFNGSQINSPGYLLVAITGGITFLTELTSNTATTEMILPILGAVATAISVHPLYLMVPATLAASCAFMLPVATPPNAIIFGSGKIRVAQMVRVGLWLNLISIIVISIFVYFYMPLVLIN